MKRILGSVLICFYLFGFVAIVLFKYFVVKPAYGPLPNGRYGEMYGPVSFFRIPTYIILGVVVGVGIWLVIRGFTRPE